MKVQDAEAVKRRGAEVGEAVDTMLRGFENDAGRPLAQSPAHEALKVCADVLRAQADGTADASERSAILVGAFAYRAQARTVEATPELTFRDLVVRWVTKGPMKGSLTADERRELAGLISGVGDDGDGDEPPRRRRRRVVVNRRNRRDVN